MHACTTQHSSAPASQARRALPDRNACLNLALCACALLLLNGCSALAVSLAGAGAGAGLSHQINGTVSRTFSEPFERVDTATRAASKRLYLQVAEIATLEGDQVTKARVGDLDVTLELETLSPTLTRVSVSARKNLFRVDSATAQEIVMQIERALIAIEAKEALARNGAATEDPLLPVDTTSRAAPLPAKRKGST